jgi:hypothetical protein
VYSYTNLEIRLAFSEIKFLYWANNQSHKISAMKKAIILALFFAFALSWSSFSQENFEKGFIITLKGDTAQGLIDFQKWSVNPSNITFKKTGNNEKISYTPLDISGFGVAGEIYKSAMVEAEKSPYLTNDLNFDAGLKLDMDTVFLYAIVEGKKGLYHYQMPNGRDNFYISSGNAYSLLVQKTYLRNVKKADNPGVNYADTYIKTENKTYLGQLAEYMNDCSSIPARLNSVEYTQTALYKLFQIYQKDCAQGLNVKKTRSMTTQFGAMAGVSLNSLKWGYNSVFDYSRTDYNFHPGIAAGLFLDALFRGNNGKWSLHNELLFAPYKVTGEYRQYINEERNTITTTEIEAAYIRMNNMIRFRYPVGDFSVFVNAGVSNAISMKNSTYFKREITYFVTHETEEGDALASTDKYELGFNVGLGLGYKNWTLDARWEQGDGMSTLALLKSTTKRIYFLVGYRF